MKYLENFKAMKNEETVKLTYMGEDYYQYSVMVTVKGLYVELEKIQKYLYSDGFLKQ